ncbi:hypothetical protein CR513_55157, partial [Mucuna pruriens]
MRPKQEQQNDTTKKCPLGSSKTKTLNTKTNKLTPNWEGPFRIMEEVGKGAYRLEHLDERYYTTHKCHERGGKKTLGHKLNSLSEVVKRPPKEQVEVPKRGGQKNPPKTIEVLERDGSPFDFSPAVAFPFVTQYQTRRDQPLPFEELEKAEEVVPCSKGLDATSSSSKGTLDGLSKVTLSMIKTMRGSEQGPTTAMPPLKRGSLENFNPKTKPNKKKEEEDGESRKLPLFIIVDNARSGEWKPQRKRTHQEQVAEKEGRKDAPRA